MPRQRNLGLTEEGRRQREAAVGLLNWALATAGLSVAGFAEIAGKKLYGAPFDRSTVYRWRRMELAIPSEVLVFALRTAKVDLMVITEGVGVERERAGEAERLDRIERLLEEVSGRLTRYQK